MDVVVDDRKSPPLLHLTESEISHKYSTEEEEAVDREESIPHGLEGKRASYLEQVEGVVET